MTPVPWDPCVQQANIYAHKVIKWINEKIGCRREFLDTRFNLSLGCCRGSGVVLKVREDSSFSPGRELTADTTRNGDPVVMKMLEHDWVKGMSAWLRGQLLHVWATRSGLGWSVFGANTLFSFYSVCDRAFSSVSGWLQNHYVAQAGLTLMMSPPVQSLKCWAWL